MIRISEELDAQKCQIAKREVEQNGECLRLNVIKQKRNGSCIFCNWLEDFVRLSAESRVSILIIKNICVTVSDRYCYVRKKDLLTLLSRFVPYEIGLKAMACDGFCK